MGRKLDFVGSTMVNRGILFRKYNGKKLSRIYLGMDEKGTKNERQIKT